MNKFRIYEENEEKLKKFTVFVIKKIGQFGVDHIVHKERNQASSDDIIEEAKRVGQARKRLFETNWIGLLYTVPVNNHRDHRQRKGERNLPHFMREANEEYLDINDEDKA